MRSRLCIHGHFYQPPRLDPWLGEILPEGSAAPMRNWNERIARECYAPLAWARRLDHEGRITNIINCYEWISFNFGPTLLDWLESALPETYHRMLEGDRLSHERLGHGNAVAQAYHHMIMPLASPLAREVEAVWAIEDFQARFKRAPEGMWLPETAVDEPTLETLAAAGIKFTVLAPRQAEAVASLDHGDWRPVGEAELDLNRPYLVQLPSGREMAVFFYHGPLSQAVAFENLLADGEKFWLRMSRACPKGGFLPLATDGETYGHHFKFGEMGLAYVLEQGMRARDGMELTNFGAALAATPPDQRVRLRCPSSWSCVHGVERWRADCGCTTRGGPGTDWSQGWRAPLRQGLDMVKQGLEAHYLKTGAGLFRDPVRALLDYGRVLSGRVESGEFGQTHFKPNLDQAGQALGMRLLSMFKWGQASQASCAWFFDELSRIEPLNGMTYALRAMELARDTGGPDLEPGLIDTLGRAQANLKGKGSGADLFIREVKPRRETPASLCAQAVFKIWAGGGLEPLGSEKGKVKAGAAWPQVRVKIKAKPSARGGFEGKARIIPSHGQGESLIHWKWRLTRPQTPLENEFLVQPAGKKAPGSELSFIPALGLAWNKRQGLALDFIDRAAADLERRSSELMLSGRSLFLDWQEAQETQSLEDRWERFWPELALSFALGPRRACESSRAAEAALARFLRQRTGRALENRSISKRLMREIFTALETGVEGRARAENILTRAERIGLQIDLWPLQNHIWRQGLENWRGSNLARKAGFAV